MAQINAIIDFPEKLPSKSSWAKFKRWVLDKFEYFACCGTADQFRDLECHRTDEHVRECIRAEMREHSGFGGEETCITQAMKTTFRETGYDLGNLEVTESANVKVMHTYAQWDDYFEKIAVNPVESVTKQTYAQWEALIEGFAVNPLEAKVVKHQRAHIVPKFAAACVLHLRAKLGALSNSEANVLLVQRKYLEVCRKHGVRDVDVVLHQGFVMNAMFTESVLDDIASSRRRLPAWMKFLDETPETGSVPNTIC